MAHLRDKYTDAQREAACVAVIERGNTYARTVALAAAGELKDPHGVPVGVFEPPLDSVRSWVYKRKLRAAGVITHPLKDVPHRDAIENLRQRCVSSAALLLASYERQVQQPAGAKKADPDRLRQIIRVVREAAALPGPTDPRPVTPGKTGSPVGGPSKPDSLAGRILQDVKGAPVEAPAVTARVTKPQQGPEDPRDLIRRALEGQNGAAGGDTG